MNNFLQNTSLPVDNIISGLIIVVSLVVAWVLAKVIATLIGRAVSKANFIKTAFQKIGVSLDMALIGNILRELVYFIIIFAAFVGVLKYLNINISLIDDILNNYLPRGLYAAGLAILAWLLATIAKTAIVKGAKTIDLSSKLGADVKTNENIKESVGTIAYWAIIIFFLPQILEKLGQNELLKPITNIIDSITSYVPNIISAIVIFVIGFFIAKVVRQITTSLLSSFGVDKASKKFGLKDFSISHLAGTLAYILILLPITIQALQALQIRVISEPAVGMLEKIFNAVPLILTASIIIFISYFIAKFVSKLIGELLAGVGFNKILALIGFKNVKSDTNPSDVAAGLVFAYILLLAMVEASSVLGFSGFASVINNFIAFATNVLVGIFIFGIGLYLAKIAKKAVKATTASKTLAVITKSVIIILTAFMGLQQMGIGGDIINLAFGISFGAVAVAFALAVGLGAKDIAAKEVENFVKNIKK